ncbi:MAG TPA: hypothetical protein VFP12_16325 [Allosphingosinicella sp.]|nr:hypothetical protein [Allosphingosinicella sp.]
MAKRSTVATPPLRFRGAPQWLSLSSPALAGHECGDLILPEALAAHCGANLSLPVRNSCAEGAYLRLRLAPTAPVGRHQAELRLSGKSVPVEIDIAARPSLRAFPPSAHFVGSPGEDPSVEIDLANRGNVAIDLPERSAVGIFDDIGLETAFAETYRSESDDPVQLLGSWLRSLRGGYGGLLKLRIDSGAGPLAPGEERSFRLSAHFPEGLKRGHSYHGVWKLGPLHHRITLAVQR